MARPHRYDLQYFPLDVHFFEDHKLLLIEEDYGITGGYVATRLLAMVYEQGYYLEWKDKQELTIARRIGNGVAGAVVLDILQSCLKHGLFDESLFNTYRVLSSKGIQKRWFQVMTQLRRKPDIDADLWLISSEETPTPTTLTSTPETITSSPETFSTQKEIKENEIKKNEKKENETEKKLAVGKSPPTQNGNPFLIQETEPFWKDLVAVWVAFGVEKFQVKPSFERDDPKIFKRIIQRLKNRADEKKIEWTQDAGRATLRQFLETTYADKWLSNNFLLSNLERQFDKFIQNQSTKKETVRQITELEYLYQRFLEGNLDNRLIHPDHFNELSKKHEMLITAGIIKKRMGELLGSNNYSEYQLYQHYEKGEETKAVIEDKIQLQRLAVLEYFERLKTEQRNV